MEQRLIDDSDIVQKTSTSVCMELERAVSHGASCIVLGLSGGNSPRDLYAQLSQLVSLDIASKLALIQIDERVVDAKHQDSNQNMIREHAALLLKKGATFYPIPLVDSSDTLENRQSIVKQYNTTIMKLFVNAQFTLAILGSGEDGHTASIFPTAILEEQNLAHSKNMVFTTINKHLGYYRISLSYHAIFSFQTVLFYVPGIGKQNIVRQIANMKKQSKYPASYVLHKHKNSILIASHTAYIADKESSIPNINIPIVITEEEKNAFAIVVNLLHYLRGPSGCSWDKKQTLESIRAHMLEESAELVDAIHHYEHAKEKDDTQKQELLQHAQNHIREEFGDVLLVWIMMIIIYQEEEKNALKTVLQELIQKLVRRHPHVFSKSSNDNKIEKNDAELSKQWNAIKIHKEGKTHKSISFHDFHPVLDVLERTKKFQDQYAKTINAGKSDTKDTTQIIKSIQAMLFSFPANVSNAEQEIAKMLYAIVELSRLYNISPTVALMRYNEINNL